MATTTKSELEKLIAQYNATPTYTPKTADQIQAQAQGEYKSYYDQLALAARQKQEQGDLALAQQRAGLQDSYDKQREASEKSYAKAYSTADRQMLSRGMQRSSYAAQTLANLSAQGAEAQQAIGEQQAAAEANIDSQRAQLASQLAAQLAQYDAGQANDVMNRVRELEDQEYQRGMANTEYRNTLSAQIYQFLRQEERDRVADDQWQKQYDESVRQYNQTHSSGSSGGGGGRSGGGSGSGSSTEIDGDAAAMGGMSWDDFMAALNGTQPDRNTSDTLNRVVALSKDAEKKAKDLAKRAAGIKVTGTANAMNSGAAARAKTKG